MKPSPPSSIVSVCLLHHRRRPCNFPSSLCQLIVKTCSRALPNCSCAPSPSHQKKAEGNIKPPKIWKSIRSPVQARIPRDPTQEPEQPIDSSPKMDLSLSSRMSRSLKLCVCTLRVSESWALSKLEGWGKTLTVQRSARRSVEVPDANLGEFQEIIGEAQDIVAVAFLRRAGPSLFKILLSFAECHVSGTVADALDFGSVAAASVGDFLNCCGAARPSAAGQGV